MVNLKSLFHLFILPNKRSKYHSPITRCHLLKSRDLRTSLSHSDMTQSDGCKDCNVSDKLYEWLDHVKPENSFISSSETSAECSSDISAESSSDKSEISALWLNAHSGIYITL